MNAIPGSVREYGLRCESSLGHSPLRSVTRSGVAGNGVKEGRAKDLKAIRQRLQFPTTRIGRYLKPLFFGQRYKRTLVVSFPKSGRTWLRVMLDQLGIRPEYTHDGSDHRLALPVGDLRLDKSAYRKQRIVFLLRDPRDVVVSGYFQSSKRIGQDHGSLSEFLRDERHGIEKTLRFDQAWLSAGPTMPRGFLIVRYEDLHDSPQRQLRRLTEFVGAGSISDDDIEAAVRFASFSHLQGLERSGALAEIYGSILKPTDADDPESFKVRRGKVGGFVDYLSPQDIAFCAETMQRFRFDAYPVD